MQTQFKLQDLHIKDLSQLGSWEALTWVGNNKLSKQNMGGWLLGFGKIILVVTTTRDIGESQENLMADVYLK